jgi:hypothetical protein
VERSELADARVVAATAERLARDRTWTALVEVHDAIAELIAAVRAGDPDAIEPAVVVLEVDPMFFRSGYSKEKLMRALAQVPVGPGHAERLRTVVVRRCRARGPRHELRALRSLARAVATPGLVADLRALPPGPPGDREAEETFIAAVAAGAG